jgi:TetR/AcrR family transcriptional regulator, transcriptional repressor for nem operon
MEEPLVRYPKEHNQETRQRIITAAGRRLKRDGIDGSGVAALMNDAGLTIGAMYTHFGSKDSLVALAIADQLHTLNANIVAQTEPGPAGLEQVVRWYLSAHHRDDPDDGCPNAALLDEIRRCTAPTRQAYTDGVLLVIDGLAARMTPEDPPAARVKALSLLGLMAGTLQLCRALTDRQLSDELLEQGLRNALALLGTE